jgi:protein-disulfide isomerase
MIRPGFRWPAASDRGEPDRRGGWAGRLALALLATVLLLPTARAAEFSAAQRAEIVQIVRDALKQDPTILRDAVAALQAEEGEHQAAASRAAIAAHHDKLTTAADPVAGNPVGDVTVVEFFDTRCPYCRKFDPIMASLLAQDHGVRLVYKDMPILGPASLLSAKALLAAKRQGAYEPLREAVMKAPPDATKESLRALAEKLKLDWPRLERDMDDPAIAAQLEANVTLARDLGVQGTPALVIGGSLVPGAIDLPELTTAVAEARSAH